MPDRALETLLAVTLVAAVAPLIAAALPGPRVPQVVILILLGIMAGPNGLGLADTRGIQLLSDIGLGFLFLLAGYSSTRTCCGSGPGGWPWRAGRSAPRWRWGRWAGWRRSASSGTSRPSAWR